MFIVLRSFLFLVGFGLELGKDAGERGHLHVGIFADPEQFVRSVEDDLQGILRNVSDGVVQGEVIAAGDGFEVAEHRIAPHRTDTFDAAGSDGARAVRNDLVEVGTGDMAQAAAMRTGALRELKEKV